MKIFYDVDTQNDFMNKDGALYVPGAEEIKPNLNKLTAYATRNRIPVMGSVDKHFGTEEYKEREGELAKNGGPFPEHCMAEAFGQKKIDETKLMRTNGWDPLSEYAYYEAHRPAGAAEVAIIELVKPVTSGVMGLYFEKQSYDVFENPALENMLELGEVKEAVVYGVATDFCVKAAVLGMQKRGVQCYVVEDAIKGVFPDMTQSALEEMAKAGAKFVKTKDVLDGKV